MNIKRYTVFNWNHPEAQRYFDDFDEAYAYACGLLPSVEDKFTLELMRAEMERLGTACIPERGGIERTSCEEANIVDCKRHQVWDNGFYEW